MSNFIISIAVAIALLGAIFAAAYMHDTCSDKKDEVLRVQSSKVGKGVKPPQRLYSSFQSSFPRKLIRRKTPLIQNYTLVFT